MIFLIDGLFGFDGGTECEFNFEFDEWCSFVVDVSDIFQPKSQPEEV